MFFRKFSQLVVVLVVVLVLFTWFGGFKLFGD